MGSSSTNRGYLRGKIGYLSCRDRLPRRKGGYFSAREGYLRSAGTLYWSVTTLPRSSERVFWCFEAVFSRAGLLHRPDHGQGAMGFGSGAARGLPARQGSPYSLMPHGYP